MEIPVKAKVWYDKRQKRFLLKLGPELEPILKNKKEIVIKIVTDS